MRCGRSLSSCVCCVTVLAASQCVPAAVRAGGWESLSKVPEMLGKFGKLTDLVGDLKELTGAPAGAGPARNWPSDGGATPLSGGAPDIEGLLRNSGLDSQSLEQKLNLLSETLGGGGSSSPSGPATSALPEALRNLLPAGASTSDCPLGQPCGNRAAAAPAAAPAPGPLTITNPYVTQPAAPAGKLPKIILGPGK